MKEKSNKGDEERFTWLHKARAEIDQKTLNMNPEEEIAWTHNGAMEALKRLKPLEPAEITRKWEELFQEVSKGSELTGLAKQNQARFGKSRIKRVAVHNSKDRKITNLAQRKIKTAKLPK